MSVDELINYFLFKKILSNFVSREEASLISGGEVRAHDPPKLPTVECITCTRGRSGVQWQSGLRESAWNNWTVGSVGNDSTLQLSGTNIFQFVTSFFVILEIFFVIRKVSLRESHTNYLSIFFTNSQLPL